MSRNPANYKWEVLVIVMIGTLMSALDSSIVNVSIPAIMADFGVSLDDIEWVVTAYMLAFATLMPLTAWLRDKVGHKWLYVASLIVFTSGSVLCGIAWNLPTLIVARVIQAVGGGALTPTGMAMITESFEPYERGKALGLWAMGAVMGPAFGPTLGGYLTKYFGWPSIFLVNLPVGIIGVYMGLSLLKPDRPAAKDHRPFDAAGFLFLGLFLVSFLLGMSKGETEGWTSHFELACAVLALIGLAGFLLVESLVPYGIMDLGLLKSPVFSACFLMTAIRSVALYGGTFLLPIFLQNFKGMDEVESGLILLPGSLLMAVLMPLGGRLGDKVSPRLLTFVGFLLLAWFFFEYKNLDLLTSDWGVVWPTMIRGVGIAVLIAPLTATAMNSIPKRSAGMAASMLNIIQQVAGSVGIAVLGVALARRAAYHINSIGNVSVGSPAYREAFSRLMARAHDLGYSHAASVKVSAITLGHDIASAGTVSAFQDSFIIGGIITLAGVLCAFMMPNKPVGMKPGEPIHME